MKGCLAGSWGAVPTSERVWIKDVIKDMLRILPGPESLNFYISVIIPALCKYLYSLKDAQGLFEAGVVRHTDTEVTAIKEEVFILTDP